jgi:murein DD-endopeptidase MepM/ murein hydrolase activator NlpD
MRALVFPVVGPTTICSAFGDPRQGGTTTHHGIDVCAPMYTPVLAPDNGEVRFGTDPMGGNVALVDATSGGTWYLAHLSSYNGENRPVQAADVVGYIGESGNAAGTVPHVHVEAWPDGTYTSYIDPTAMLAAATHYAVPPRGLAHTPSRLSTAQAVAVAAAILAAAAYAASRLAPPRTRAASRRLYRPSRNA